MHPRQAEAERARRRALFAPAFERLVILIRGRIATPPDWDAWQGDDRDDFRVDRQAVADSLVDAACAHAACPMCAVESGCCAPAIADWHSRGSG